MCFPTTFRQRSSYLLKFLHGPLCIPTSYFSISFQGQEVICSLLFLSFHCHPDPLKVAPLHTNEVWKLQEIKFPSLTQWQVHPFLLCWWKKNSSCPTRTIKLLSSSLWLAVIEYPCINIFHGGPRGGISHLLSAVLHTPEFDKTPRRMIKAAINLSRNNKSNSNKINRYMENQWCSFNYSVLKSLFLLFKHRSAKIADLYFYINLAD